MAKKQPGPVKQAKAIVGAQYAPIDFAAKQAQARSRQEQAALNASRTALVQLLQGGVAPAGQAYDAAVAQTGALAKGAADLLAQANPNTQIQGDLNTIGAPAEQHTQLGSQLQGLFPGQGAVLNVQEGSIPGASLLAQKAAEQGYLAGLPTVAALSGEQSLRGLLAKAHDEQNRFTEQRLQIGGQLPGLVSQLTEQGYQHQQDALNRAFQQQELQWRSREAALDRAAQAATTPLEAAQIQVEKQKIALARQQAKQQASLGGLTPYQAAELAQGQQRIDISKGKTVGGLTPTQTRAARAKGNQLVGHVREARAQGTEPTYDEAVKQAEQQGIPLEIVVPMLNKIYPAQYMVTKRGLVQTGIRGQPSWKRGGKGKRDK